MRSYPVKEKTYQLSILRDPSVQTDKQTSCYFIIRIAMIQKLIAFVWWYGLQKYSIYIELTNEI